MKVLLLNPPSREKHLRGNYCSNVSKGRYYYPAVDLLVQSGILAGAFEIEVCDAVASGVREEELLSRAREWGGVLAVTGSSSRRADLTFLSKLKERNPSLRLLLSGGYLLTQSEEVFREAPFVDGALLDFTSAESIRFFRGEFPSGVALKGSDARDISYPLPRHELFPLRAYHHPNARRHPFSLLVHSTGCPYTCDYCIYSITPYKVRPVADVVEELSHLSRLGVHEAFFHDPTFAVKREDGLALCEAMVRSRLDMSWFCQTRVDLMDEGILSQMRRAGCHAIMFGVETVSEELLREHKRRLSHEKTREVYRICRKLGIRTLSYLVIGLPGDTQATIEATVDFVKEIGSDFVSFNLAIPVIGTGFRERVLQEGLAAPDLIEFDNSSDTPAMPTRHLTRDALAQVHRRAVRSFYSRPGYLLRRLLAVRSTYELANHIREGWGVLRHVR